MDNFTPLRGMIGGSMIGTAASILLILNGDIMGISGIVHPLVLDARTTWSQNSWKWIFVASMFTTVARLGDKAPWLLIDPGESENVHSSAFSLALGGLLVGVGTKLGNGCTSGHGICGLGRFSLRSLAAVCTFMMTAILGFAIKSPHTEATKKYTTFLRQDVPWESNTNIQMALSSIVFLIAVLSLISGRTKTDQKKMIGAGLAGSVFAVGLAVAQMTASSKLNGFLDIGALWRSTYDPTLATVMGGGVLVSILSYQFIKGKRNPIFASSFGIPSNTVIDKRLVVGAALFGLGMGLSGWCPGPAVFHAATGHPGAAIIYLPSFWTGGYAAKAILQRQ